MELVYKQKPTKNKKDRKKDASPNIVLKPLVLSK